MAEPTAAWVVVAEYGAVLEADFAAATLEEAGIPARVTGAHLGVFGAGYQGHSMFGVRLMVPWHREDDARHVLDGLSLDEDQSEEEEVP
ncbi:MAG TPA: DUF2007 domain-containing protein [Longimicrobium sp.]|jgi:hypothetical protein|nr:DUF2007 domain-containing protein [Longimicrobium sp.]